MTGSLANLPQMQNECLKLMDACTPQVYRRNFFRITGLAVDARPRDIRRKIDSLRHAEEFGDADQEQNHVFAINPPPTLEQIREAAQRVEDPERRIVEEFFWFWPTEWGQGGQDAVLAELSNGNGDAAHRIWKEESSGDHGVKVIVAKHNLAVWYHLLAIDGEHISLSSNLSEEQRGTIDGNWQESFKLWEELTEDEAFWSFLTGRIRMLAEARLPTGLVRRMQKTLPEALDKINAMLAISFAECGKWALVEKQVQYMQQTHCGQDNISRTLAATTMPLRTRVRFEVDIAIAAAQREPANAAHTAKALHLAVAGPLRVIKVLLPPGTYERVDLFDEVALACLKLGIAYAHETEDWTATYEIVEEALQFAISSDTTNRIKNNLSTVVENLGRSLMELLVQDLRVLQVRPMVGWVVFVNTSLLPQLRKIKGVPGMPAHQYGEYADLVAKGIRNLSVDLFNQTSDVAAALSLLEIGIVTAIGVEVKAHLRNEKAQLLRYQAQSERNRQEHDKRQVVKVALFIIVVIFLFFVFIGSLFG